MAVTVHLVRHGQTAHYEGDAGLTELGVEQARRRGQALATAARDGERVDLVHAPTTRARRTVEVLGESLQTAARDAGKTVIVRMLGSDEGFANVRVHVDGRGWEPTQVRAEQRRLAAGPAPHPGWVIESGRFWQADATSGGAMRFWLTNPLLWHESPADVVRRLIRTVRTRISAPDAGSRVVAATHSGCLRALVAWASGSDPGEPHNGEDITVQLAGDLVTVSYAGDEWRMRYPIEPLQWSAGHADGAASGRSARVAEPDPTPI